MTANKPPPPPKPLPPISTCGPCKGRGHVLRVQAKWNDQRKDWSASSRTPEPCMCLWCIGTGKMRGNKPLTIQERQ